MTDEPLVIVPVPSLASVLRWHEEKKGAPLTREEVAAISDNAVCMTMPASIAASFLANRGPDVRLDYAWVDWLALKAN
jgi:hypothetical protein